MNEISRSGSHAKLFFRGRYFLKGLKTISCYAVFYSDRMVIVTQDPKMIKAETKRIKAELKAEKVGLLRRGKRIEDYFENYGRQFADMEMETALGLDKRNVAIRYADVEKAVYQRVWEDMGSGSDDMSTTHPGHLLLKCDKSKTRIQHMYEKDPSVEQPLDEIFGDLLKIRG